MYKRQDWSDGEKSQHIIRATLKRLDEVGPDYWTGYSYSWLANMKARAFDGEGDVYKRQQPDKEFTRLPVGCTFCPGIRREIRRQG